MARPLVAAAVLAAVMAAGAASGEFFAFVVGLAFVWMVAVTGLHLLLNDAGQISLAHGAFVAVGAFTAAHVAGALGSGGLLPALAAGTVAAAAAGGLVSLPVLRMQGFAVAITTWLFAIAADRFLFTQPWFVGETAGLTLPLLALGPVRLVTARAAMLFTGIVAACAIAAGAAVRSSRFGRSLAAVRSNEAMAASVGIDVRGTKVAVFVVAGAFAGLAGGLWAVMLGRAVPSSFPPVISVTFLAVTIIGGRGSLWGPLVASVAFSAGPQLFGGLGRALLYVSEVALILVLVRFPGGMNEQGRHASTLHRRVRRKAAA